jgi:cyclopropane fatty-acyl-phospholipid synthase-like methyltransferase
MKEFERWESRFRDPDYLFGTAPNAFLARQRERLPPSGRALAVADGEGRNGVWLAEQGLDVLSIDFSPSAQAKARALARARNVSLTTELVDVNTWDWPQGGFSVIAVIFTQFAGPEQRGRMFAGVRRALDPGGLLLMQGYTPKQLEFGTGGPSVVENMYTHELLQEAFGDFDSLEILAYEAELNEGVRHAGMSAVIDLVGRKPA